MARLTYSARKSLPKSDFALPGKRAGGKGGYPIPDKPHARNALARVAQHGSSAQKAEVREKVHSKFPGIGGKSVKHEEHKPRGERPSESLERRGSFKNHGKGEISHAEFNALDHGMKADHMPSRDGKADGKHGNDI